MSEERFIKIICVALKVSAWAILIFGIAFSFIISLALAPLLLTSRWSGVAVLFFFIALFLSINLIIKIAELALKIKKKVEA